MGIEPTTYRLEATEYFALDRASGRLISEGGRPRIGLPLLLTLVSQRVLSSNKAKQISGFSEAVPDPSGIVRQVPRCSVKYVAGLGNFFFRRAV
jgi:hypothetical protein